MSPSAPAPSFWRRLLERLGVLPPGPCTSVAALAAGPCHLVGLVGAPVPLVAPISREPCAAYAYEASMLATRTRATPRRLHRRRRLRQLMVYATPLEISLEDGVVEVEPPGADPFGPEDHEALAGHGFLGFRAREELLQAGEQVRVMGRCRWDKARARWVVAMRHLERVPDE